MGWLVRGVVARTTLAPTGDEQAAIAATVDDGVVSGFLLYVGAPGD
ncbi:MAG TPA: hypothetical protein VFZ00_22220 [Solirubrobacter sp.]|nr:hypothetical protein [Solirubrobacter sp.]